MNTKRNDELTAKERIDRRAQWESFEFAVCPGVGKVNIVNTSYNDDGNHTYTVSVEDGEATDCTCPANQHRPGACKHRVAVSQQPAVLKAASTRLATDGGHTAVSASEDSSEDAQHDESNEGAESNEESERDRCMVCGAAESLSSSTLRLHAHDGRWLSSALCVCVECADRIERAETERRLVTDGGHSSQSSLTDHTDPLSDFEREGDCRVCDDTGWHGEHPCYACLVFEDRP